MEPDNAILVDLDHVTLRFERGVVALNDVSLRIHEGERICILGANGSGKSTLASVLCGLLAPDQGGVSLLGRKVAQDGDVNYDAYEAVRRELGLVFQNPDDQIVTTVVEDDVAFGPENLGMAPEQIETRVRRELKRVAMQSFAKADPTRLSGGQKQRVAIAGALAMEPRVLVLDEPGSSLDVRGRRSIMRVMNRLHAAGTTIVHVTHFMEEALCADRVIVMDHGRIILEGEPQRVFSQGDTIRNLGLEEPFSARLASRLAQLGVPVRWTCSADDLKDQLVNLGKELEVDDLAPAGTRSRLGARDEVPASQSPHATEGRISASGVSYSYAGTNGRQAVGGASFEIVPGTSCALIGQTGSGKSTLLRLICALEKPDAGRLEVNGFDVSKRRERRMLHGQVGYVMQHPERQLFAETVWEDVAFGPTNLGLSVEEVGHRCVSALDLVGLADQESASPFDLSGGQQRLCAIAGVLAMRPRLLILDEPMAGLDPRGRQAIRSILGKIHSLGVTVVQVTHSMEDAALQQQVIVLDQGSVVAQGTPHEVFNTRTGQTLHERGLGLPQPLSWAQELAASGLDLGQDPLNLNDLARAIAHQLDPAASSSPRDRGKE